MRYSHQIVARLQASEGSFNLRHYREQTISMRMGTVVFGLLQDELSLPAMTLVTRELSIPDQEVSGQSVDLEPGARLRLGRIFGMELLDASGSPDNARIRELGGDILLHSLRQTDTLSRRHAQVDVIDAWTVLIKDLGSTNGTYILGDPEDPEVLRRQLRVVS